MELTAPDYMILIVEDLDRALHFYTEVLGLRLGHRSGNYAQLDTGATRLALYTRSAMAKTLGMSLDPPAANAPGFEVGFKVADVDAAFNELVAHGALPVVAPTDRFWGQRTAYVRDPDGHLVELANFNGTLALQAFHHFGRLRSNAVGPRSKRWGNTAKSFR